MNVLRYACDLIMVSTLDVTILMIIMFFVNEISCVLFDALYELVLGCSNCMNAIILNLVMLFWIENIEEK